MVRRYGLIFSLSFALAATVLSQDGRAADLGPFADMADHALAPGALAELRGGAQANTILENLQAELTGNTVTGNYTGTNVISGGAFAGAQGVFNTFQNFGNNVIYQSVINVSVTSIQ